MAGIDRTQIVLGVLGASSAVAAILLVFEGFVLGAYANYKAGAGATADYKGKLRATAYAFLLPVWLAVLVALSSTAWLIGADLYWITVGGFLVTLFSLLGVSGWAVWLLTR